jgi:hypothetical protein
VKKKKNRTSLLSPLLWPLILHFPGLKDTFLRISSYPYIDGALGVHSHSVIARFKQPPLVRMKLQLHFPGPFTKHNDVLLAPGPFQQQGRPGLRVATCSSRTIVGMTRKNSKLDYHDNTRNILSLSDKSRNLGGDALLDVRIKFGMVGLFSFSIVTLRIPLGQKHAGLNFKINRHLPRNILFNNASTKA